MDTASVALPTEVKAKLDEAVRRIVSVADPQLIILFGSYAEGRGHEHSDLDLLVVAETDSWPSLSGRLREQLRPVLAPLKFDLLVYTPETWEWGRRIRGFVTRDADRKGIRLYETA
jgi:predicted nucleotidyltransferase